MKKILITGATGIVGRSLRAQLQGRYILRLLVYQRDENPVDSKFEDEVVFGDVMDMDQMICITRGVDSVIHLATPKNLGPHRAREYDQSLLDTNVKGTYNVFEACRANRVKKIIYASSNQLTRGCEDDELVASPESLHRPKSMYGVSKAFGESLGRYYYEAHGISVYNLRIANFPGTPTVNRKYAKGENRWLSPSDLGRLVQCCLTDAEHRFGVYYAVSPGGERKWDVSNSQSELGWVATDRS